MGDRMEKHFPRCVQCLGALEVESGFIGTLKTLLDRPLTCPSCGRQMSRAEAQLIADKFAECVTRFHRDLQRAVDILPVLKAADAQRALDLAAPSARQPSRVHDREELYRLVVRQLRAALRQEAQGHRCPITLDMMHMGAINAAIQIHIAQERSPVEALIVIVRVGADDYLMLEAQREPGVAARRAAAAVPAGETAPVSPRPGSVGV